MKSTKIPYLYSRNGIFYYRYQSTWKSLKTRCKREAFRKCSHILFGTSSSADDHQPLDTVTKTSVKKETVPQLSKLIQAYMKENGSRWNAREYTRVNSILKFLPKGIITREVAIELKGTILKTKTVTTFNRYLNYFTAFYRWVIANNAQVITNPFEGLKVIEKKTSMASKRNAYTTEQLKTLFKFADQYGKNNMRYWLIMIGRYTGARMNEICQLKPSDVTSEYIHIRGVVNNAKVSSFHLQ